MRYIVFVCLAFLCACETEPVRVNSNAPDRPMRTEQLQDSRVHTTENQPPVQSTGGKWTASGDPIDTAKFDAAITAAEKTLKAKPTDPAAKKAVAEAYFERGVALTEARQYASAIGDYRRALKHDPTHEESKKWIDQIIGIYAMLKKEAPKEGEEPPPLPHRQNRPR